jgi:uncharacterized protein (DUF1800 family)
MGTPTVSRRDFFKSLTLKKQSDNDPNDPLFEKYARKTLGPRVFVNELVNYNENNFARLNGNDTLRVGNVTSGLNPYGSTAAWTSVEALHLLKRIGFGYKKVDVDTLVAAGSADAAVNIILNINNTPPAPPVVWYGAPGSVNYPALDANGIAYGADWTNNPSPYVSAVQDGLQQTSNYYRIEGLRRWLFGQALNQDITIREKMVWFWYHFIPIDFEAIDNSSNSRISQNSARIDYSYFKMFRDGCLGNFKTLIKNVAKHPCMMFYLNNQANTATAPDENFARELMELFTLGKDPASQYTQADVVEAAKVLTGWRVLNLSTATPTTTYDPTKHKTGNKTFSSFFSSQVITAPTTAATTTATTMDAEFNALIDMIFNKSLVVSQYVCRRLYRYFVYYDIDANIEANVIVPLAQTFVASNWDILPVLQQLFKSEHFYDMANRGVYIKTPFDFIVGTAKMFNLNHNVSDQTNYEAQYRLWADFNDGRCLPMEQRMGSIPNVSGWNAFYQTPSFHEYWINTNTIQKRFSFLSDIFSGYTRTYSNTNPINTLATIIKVDVLAYVQQFPANTILNPNLLVAECIKYLLPMELSQAQRDTIKQQTLLYQQVTDSYWTTAWNNYIGAPTNTTYKNLVTDRVKNLLYTIIQLAEFQLM